MERPIQIISNRYISIDNLILYNSKNNEKAAFDITMFEQLEIKNSKFTSNKNNYVNPSYEHSSAGGALKITGAMEKGYILIENTEFKFNTGIIGSALYSVG